MREDHKDWLLDEITSDARDNWSRLLDECPGVALTQSPIESLLLAALIRRSGPDEFLEIYSGEWTSPLQPHWSCHSDLSRRIRVYPQWVLENYRFDFRIEWAAPGPGVDEYITYATALVECDGHEWHKTKEQRGKDAEKSNLAAKYGLHVIRFTGTQLHREMEKCLDSLLEFQVRLYHEYHNRRYPKAQKVQLA